MINNILSPIIHIMRNCGRYYRSLFVSRLKIGVNEKAVLRLIKRPPGSLDQPLVRHRDYDLEGVWDE